jgi:hypothetical protein
MGTVEESTIPMIGKLPGFAIAFALIASSAQAICPYDANCLNNPYGGRDPYAPPGVPVAPYGAHSVNGQLGSAFNANPLRYGAVNNPYAPALKPDDSAGAPVNAPANSGLGSGLGASPGALQGVDPDRQ